MALHGRACTTFQGWVPVQESCCGWGREKCQLTSGSAGRSASCDVRRALIREKTDIMDIIHVIKSLVER